VLAHVEAPDELAGVRIYREPGYVFTPLRRGADRAGAILVTADSRAEAVARADAAAKRIRFLTADAANIL
jgi:hypothetical protein